MSKNEIIDLCSALGFILEYDEWSEKLWMRFVLRNGLHGEGLVLIWYDLKPKDENLRQAARVLFRAGQQAKINQLNEIIEL